MTETPLNGVNVRSASNVKGATPVHSVSEPVLLQASGVGAATNDIMNGAATIAKELSR